MTLNIHSSPAMKRAGSTTDLAKEQGCYGRQSNSEQIGYESEEEEEPVSVKAGSADHDHQADATNTSIDKRQENECIYHRRHDLKSLNLLDQPVWVFDIVKRQMWYANDAAVELWSAKSLKDLLARSFKDDMSEATKARLDEYLIKFAKGEQVVDQWTFYPNQQGPKTVDCVCKGIHIEEGRLAMLLTVQGTHQDTKTDAERQALRAVEMLRHLPVAVCITDLEGNLIEQNPEALAVFGPIDDTPKQQINGSSSDDEEKDEEEFHSTFVKRFVDKDLGKATLIQAASEPGKVIRLETKQETMHGPKWSAIEVRQTKDPVTSNPILLYSTRDITAIVEAKRQAVAADVAKQDIVKELAYAVRSPLQNIMGAVELMIRQQHQEEMASSCCVPQLEDYTKSSNANCSNLLLSAAKLLMTVIQDLMDGSQTKTYPSIEDDCSNLPHKGTMRSNGIESTVLGSCFGHTKVHKNTFPFEHTTRFDIKQLFNRVLMPMKQQAQAKNLSLNLLLKNRRSQQCKPWDTNDGIPLLVIGDAVRLGQVLSEILTNAIKNTSVGGITITLQRLPQSRSQRVRLRFDIKDTGVGLNLEQQKTCMMKDVTKTTNQSKQLTTDSGGNLARDSIGLVQCRGIVESMGGMISIRSKPGQGSTFRIEVPLLRPSTTKSSPCGFPSSSSSSILSSPSKAKMRRTRSSSLEPVFDEGGLHILLVDEDNVGRTITKTLLEQLGHTVVTADSGDVMMYAVSQRSWSFDVVLMETKLSTPKRATSVSGETMNSGSSSPRLSTLEAVRQIRSMGYSSDSLPILALTAESRRGDCFGIGLNDWLTKPIFMKDVQTAITNAICNIAGASSVGTGTFFDGERSEQSFHKIVSQDYYSYRNGGGSASTGDDSRDTNSIVSSSGDVCPTIPKRGSFSSIQFAEPISQ